MISAASVTNDKRPTTKLVRSLLSEYLVLVVTIVLFLALAPFTPALLSIDTAFNIVGYLLPLLAIAGVRVEH